MQTDGLIEVILYVKNMQAMVEFYRDRFSLRITFPQDVEDFDREPWVVFDTGGCSLALHAGGQGHAKPDAPKIVFQVDDIYEARQELVDMGVEMSDIRSAAPNIYVSDGSDPEGHSFSIEIRLPFTRSELIDRIEAGRAEIEAVLMDVGEDEKATRPVGHPWTIKDHLAHIAAWEAGMAALLRKEPRYAAMGVEPDQVESGADGINAAIYQRSRDSSLQEVLEWYVRAHQDLLAAIEGLADEDLFRPYGTFQPDEPGRDIQIPVVWFIAGNTYLHYGEHLAEIRSVLSALLPAKTPSA